MLSGELLHSYSNWNGKEVVSTGTITVECMYVCVELTARCVFQPRNPVAAVKRFVTAVVVMHNSRGFICKKWMINESAH